MGGRMSKGPPELSPYEKELQRQGDEALLEQQQDELANMTDRQKYQNDFRGLPTARTGLTKRKHQVRPGTGKMDKCFDD
jgi:hypothetical protein